MINLNTPERERHGELPVRQASTRNEDTLALTWLIGVATAIVAGGYLFLAQSTRDDLKAINVIAARPAHTAVEDTRPVAAYSPMSEPPAELRK